MYGRRGANLSEPKDFMLIWDKKQREQSTIQSPEEIKRIFEAIAANMRARGRTKNIKNKR